MSAAVAAVIRSETRVSVVINMALSAAFFFAAFGISARPLTLAAPDKFALDFLPQSLAIGFFAALVPALLISNKRRKGLISGLDIHADGILTLLVRAFAMAVICGIIGVIMALVLPSMAGQSAYHPALGFKIIYGGLLAVLVTPRALRMALTSRDTPTKSKG